MCVQVVPRQDQIELREQREASKHQQRAPKVSCEWVETLRRSCFSELHSCDATTDDRRHDRSKQRRGHCSADTLIVREEYPSGTQPYEDARDDDQTDRSEPELSLQDARREAEEECGEKIGGEHAPLDEARVDE